MCIYLPVPHTTSHRLSNHGLQVMKNPDGNGRISIQSYVGKCIDYGMKKEIDTSSERLRFFFPYYLEDHRITQTINSRLLISVVWWHLMSYWVLTLTVPSYVYKVRHSRVQIRSQDFSCKYLTTNAILSSPTNKAVNSIYYKLGKSPKRCLQHI